MHDDLDPVAADHLAGARLEYLVVDELFTGAGDAGPVGGLGYAPQRGTTTHGLGYARDLAGEVALGLEPELPVNYGQLWHTETPATLADVVALALEAGATSLDVEIAGVTASFRPSTAGDASESPLSAPLLPVQHRERLPWTNYSEPLREALKALALVYPPDMVAAAAAELELLIAYHGRPRPAQDPAASV